MERTAEARTTGGWSGGVAQVRRMVDRVLHFADRPHTGKRNAHPASVGAIATWLNERGVPTRHGGDWRPPTVERVLLDPRITGLAAEPLYRTDKQGNSTRTQHGYRLVLDSTTGEPVNAYVARVLHTALSACLPEAAGAVDRGASVSRLRGGPCMRPGLG